MEKKAPRKQKQSRASLGDLVSYAAFLSDSQRLKELVCRGAKKLPRLVDSHGCTALHVLASVPGSGEMMEWMLENSGIEVDKADRESLWTALHRSIYYGNVTAAISLIKHGASVYREDREGLTPLDLLDCNRPWTKELTHKDTMHGTVLLTWGLNNNMTLGHADEVSRTHPDRVCAFSQPTHADIIQVVLSKFHSVFLAGDGRVFTCGHGHGGRLGHGDEQSHVIPHQIKSLYSIKCVGVAAARDHTVFLSDGGEVSTCGLNDCCQLGYSGTQGSTACKQSLFPRRVKFFRGQRVTQVAAGRYHTAVCTESELFTWGQNEGQLGYPKTDVTQNTPKQVTHLPKGCEILLLCASDAATACCTGDGEIFVLHDCTCRKISVTPFGPSDLPVKLCISASLGHLGSVVENVEPTVLLALTKYGEVWKWTPGHRVMFRCRWLNKNGLVRAIRVADVVVGKDVFAVSIEGQLYKGSFNHRNLADKKANLPSSLPISCRKPSTRKPLERHIVKCDEADREAKCVVVLERFPHLHRVERVFADFKGQNIAVIQNEPISLSQFPQVSVSSFAADMQALLDEADTMDSIHDVEVKIGESHDLVPLHRFILSSRSSYFKDIFSNSQPAVVELRDIQSNVFSLILSYLYTGQHDRQQVMLFSGRDKELSVLSMSEYEQKDVECQEMLEEEEELIDCVFGSTDMGRESDGDFSSSEDEILQTVYSHSQRVVIANTPQLARQRSFDRRNKSSEPKTPLSPNSTSAFAVYQTVHESDEGERKLQRRGSRSNRGSEMMPSVVEKLYDASIKLGLTGLSRSLEDQYQLQHVSTLKHQSAFMDRLEWRSCGHLCDLTIIAEDCISLECHKCILIARSEYFRSMLTMGWKETASGPVSLSLPFPSNVLQVVIDFIYSDEAPSVNGCSDLYFIGSVLTAADQMLMIRLKEICEAAIARLMSVRTVVEFLDFSDMYGANQLKKAALTFISLNLADLVEGGYLKDLNRALADDITVFYRNMIHSVGGRVLRMSGISFDNWDVSGSSGSPTDKDSANMRITSKQTDRSGSDVKDNIENDTVATKVEVKQTDMEGLLEPQGVLCSPSPSKAEAEEMTAVDQASLIGQTVGIQSTLWTRQRPQIRTKSLEEIMAEEQEKVKQHQLQRLQLLQPILRPSSAKENLRSLVTEGNTAICWSVVTPGKTQKQRYQLGCEDGDCQPTEQSSPTNPWKLDLQQISPPVSFRHLIAEQLENDEKGQGHRTVSSPRSIGQTAMSSEMTSPLRGWHIHSRSPESLADIVRSQEQVTLHSLGSLNKPLAVIQIEDKAIEELLEHYGGLFHPEESIRVARASMAGRP